MLIVIYNYWIKKFKNQIYHHYFLFVKHRSIQFRLNIKNSPFLITLVCDFGDLIQILFLYKQKKKFNKIYTPFLWYRVFYDTAVFILPVPMHCSATRRFFYLYIHKHNSHIYRNVWSFCPNVLNFCKYTHFYLFLRNSRHFYFTLIPCFVKCPIIKP